MIAYVEGVISEKTPTRIIVEVNGIGYELLIPVSTFEKLPEIGRKEKLLTYQHVREDVLQLFGFLTPQEKTMFMKLISVTGVGPKLALGILSGCHVENLKNYIANGEVATLTRLPGLGKKTAERLVLELRDKLEASEPQKGQPHVATAGVGRKLQEAVLALVSLGYTNSSAEKAISQIMAKEPDLPIDELIRRALQST